MDTNIKPKPKTRGYESASKIEGRTWLTDELRKKHLIGLPISARLLNALEEYRLSVGDDVSRPEAVRMILSSYLREKQFLKNANSAGSISET